MEAPSIHTKLETFTAFRYRHDEAAEESDEERDRWGASFEQPQHNQMNSTEGSQGFWNQGSFLSATNRPTSKLPPLTASSSAPLMRPPQDNMMRTTSLSFSRSSKGSSTHSWRAKPMHGSWGSEKSKGLPSFQGTLPGRSNVDEGANYVDGAIPNWMAGQQMRSAAALAHELSWQYIYAQKHKLHPLRQEVGEELDKTATCVAMRKSKSSAFQFWRDLRPPFSVMSVQRKADDESGHPDGDLHQVHYACGIDYDSERVFNNETTMSTFDNVIEGVCEVRIPPGWPVHTKNIRMLSWGNPCLKIQFLKPVHMNTSAAPQKSWNPVASILGRKQGKNSCCSRLLNDAYRKQKKDALEVPEDQKLLLGPSNASLEKRCRLEAKLQMRKAAEYKKLRGEQVEGVTGEYLEMSDRFGDFLSKVKEVDLEQRKRRTYRMYTSCSGIISFAG